LLSLCTFALSDPIVSVLGLKAGSGNLTAPSTYAPVLIHGRTVTTLQIPGSGLDFLYMVAAYAGPLSRSYYVMDRSSHLFQIDTTTGAIGQITTYSGVYSPNCMAYDRSRGVLVVAARDGVFVLDPLKSEPVSSIVYDTDNVTNCQVNAASQELWIVTGEEPKAFTIVNYATGKIRKIDKLPAAPLSVDFSSEGVFYLSNSAPWKQWGGTSVLTLANANTGETIRSYNYTFPEGGMVPSDHSANAVVGLDSSDPSHVLLASILWDTENSFVCTGYVESRKGQFWSEGGTFAAFGFRPEEFISLAVEASV